MRNVDGNGTCVDCGKSLYRLDKTFPSDRCEDCLANIEKRLAKQQHKDEAFNEIAWKVANVKFVHSLSCVEVIEILDNLINRYKTGKDYDNNES